ncbi:hypothetical protein ABIB94_007412 [Bradyrhizobium sp. JR7.2]|uniref:cyclophilin-like fold protein n=1 Tax=unclassified Bradyrhizobium TaxID=2631580 RepID=UPI0007C1CEA7|nr:cyclophilin-like fold protein [Bradyrhizobium sp.]CUT16558.1 Threonine dehydrogenase and related Zndependent dehydrogenases CDS [Bradyrhizobium sp.]
MKPTTENGLSRRRLVFAMISTDLMPQAAFAETTAVEAQTGGTATMRIRCSFADQTFTVTLEDNPSAREFAAMLPLDLGIEDYSTNEKIAYLPRRLTEERGGPFSNEAPGDLCYYAPWGNLKSRQELARDFGATDIVAERGALGIERVKELTAGVGADSVLECVGTQESMTQAIDSVRPGGSIGYVGVPHGVTFDGQAMFFAQRRMLGGPAPVRRFLPDLMDRVLKGRIKPGKVFDLSLPLSEVAEGYRAMDERRAIKTMLTV